MAYQLMEHAATKAGRLSSVPGRVMPKTCKTAYAGCLASFSALMGGCKRTVHTRCCHWLATSAAFTAKAVTWSTAQASRNGRRRPLVTLRKEYRNRVWVELGLNITVNSLYSKYVVDRGEGYFFREQVRLGRDMLLKYDYLTPRLARLFVLD